MSENTEKPTGYGSNGAIIPPVKGEIRNPAGKPKGTRNRSTIVREMIEAAACDALKSKLDLGLTPTTIFEQLVATQIVKASLGDANAINFLTDSAFGKLTDKVNTTHTFRRMGNVEAIPAGGAQPSIAGAPAPVALTFDVGEDAAHPENDVEEGEEP